MLLSRLKIVSNNDKIVYDVQFAQLDKDPSGPFSTVIIGVNGAGKSYLLSVIAEIFLNCTKQKPRWRYKTYELDYFYKGELKKIRVDNGKIEQYDRSDLNILAVSFMVDDKFIFSRSSGARGRYRYLGARRSANAAYTGEFETKTISNLLTIGSYSENPKNIRSVFDMLGFEFKARLEVRLNSKFNENTYEKLLQEKFSNEKVQQNNRPVRYADKLLNEIYKTPERMDEIIHYIKNIMSNKNKDVIDLLPSSSTFNDFIFTTLTKVRVLEYDLKLYKTGDEFSFKWASSGEKQMLFSLLNLITCMKDNTLVLIDEPEMSLHPNWQMRYIGILKELLADYNCHILLATHSHYLVSDLERATSSIIPLEARTPVTPLDADTYGWSAENILYKVFGARTTRNYYFEQDLKTFINLYADIKNRKSNMSKIKELSSYFERYVLSDTDPLKTLLNDIKQGMQNEAS